MSVGIHVIDVIKQWQENAILDLYCYMAKVHTNAYSQDSPTRMMYRLHDFHR